MSKTKLIHPIPPNHEASSQTSTGLSGKSPLGHQPSTGLNEVKTSDLHVVETLPLLAPSALKAELPLTKSNAVRVVEARNRIRNILDGRDRRLLVIVGPCSIHNVDAAREYGQKLAQLRMELEDSLEIVMRVYFEKPRTTIGWKGLINDPHLDGSFDINSGLRLARQLLLEITELGLPAATELLDPIIPQYIADVISWTAIGARTTESQTHREMSSGLSMPVGFKNGTDGSIEVAVNAMLSAQHSHRFLGIDYQGAVSIVTTTGNPDGHLVLRGGKQGPNYDAANVNQIASDLVQNKLNPRMMVDCSHDNSGKDYSRQPLVLKDIAEQVAGGAQYLMGVMIESHLVAGKQAIPQDIRKLTYGQSITDGCVDFPTTADMLRSLAAAVKTRQL